MADEHEDSGRAQEAEALAELTLCENLAQTSGWAARWSGLSAGADGALLWAPDSVHPLQAPLIMISDKLIGPVHRCAGCHRHAG